MILGLEIGLLIAGLVALVTGKFKLSKDRVATGAVARFAGFLLILPLPLSFGVGFVMALEQAVPESGRAPADLQTTLIFVELGITLACGLIGLCIALLASSRPSEDGVPPQRPRNDRAGETAPLADEGPLWVVPVEGPREGISAQRPEARTAPAGPSQGQARQPAGRPAPAKSSSSAVVWWVLGGLAVCFFCCAAPAGGLLLWWLLPFGYNQPKASGPVVAQGNAPLGRQEEWGNDKKRAPQFPQFILPPLDQPPGVGGLPGMAAPGGPAQAPAVKNDPPPQPPPVVKKNEPPPGLRAAIDLGSGPVALALSPDSQTLAVATQDRVLTLWDLAGNRQRARLAGNAKALRLLTFSPDGRWLACGDGGPFVTLREAATGRQQAALTANPNAFISDAVFAPDSQSVITVTADFIHHHDLKTGVRRDFFRGNPEVGRTSWISAEFSADGRRLFLSGTRNGRRERERADAFWDVATGRRDQEVKLFPGSTAWVLMAPDERHFLSTLANGRNDRLTIYVWDRTAGRQVTTLEAPTEEIGCAFSPDGQHLAVAYADGLVRLWDYKSGKELARFETNAANERPLMMGGGHLFARLWGQLAFAADGKSLVVGTKNGFKVWDAEKVFGRPFPPSARKVTPPPAVPLSAPEAPGLTGVRELFTFRPHDREVKDLAVSADGRLLATGTGTPDHPGATAEVKLWQVSPRQELARSADDWVGHFTPDGKQMLHPLRFDVTNFLSLPGRNNRSVFGVEMELRDARTLRQRPGGLRCAGWAYSADGRTVLAAGTRVGEPTLRLYDLNTLKEIETWKRPTSKEQQQMALGPATCPPAFDAVSRCFVCLSGNDVQVCDGATGELRFTCKGHTGAVRCVAFSPDGKRFATAGFDHTVRVWDAATGKGVAVLEGHTGAVAGLAYAHDGRLLVSLGQDDTVRLWDTSAAKEIAALDQPKNVSQFKSMALAPGGKVLAVSHGAEVRAWDVSARVGPRIDRPAWSAARIPPPAPAPPPKPPAPPPKPVTVRERRSLPAGDNNTVNALAFAPDGRELLAGGTDGRVRRWRLPAGEELSTSFDAHPRAWVRSVALSADGKLLATAGTDQKARVWDPATNKLLATCSDWSGMRAALSADGQWLATAANHLRLWDAPSGRFRGLLTQANVSGPLIESVTFSPDGKWLACAVYPNRVRVWSMAEKAERCTFSGHTGDVLAVALSSDGRTVASGGRDRTVKLWDMPANKERLTRKGHAEAVTSLAFSPDGKRLVSGGGGDRFKTVYQGELKLWDVATGHLLAELRGHSDGVSAVAFAPDGKTVASGGRDHTVRLWDVSAFAGRAAAP